MVNEEILGGLRSALERGESLKKAINTLSNSGYKKEEIEEAAKALTEQVIESPMLSATNIAPISPKIQQPIFTQPVQKVSAYGEQTQQVIQQPFLAQPQRVSNYGVESSREKAIIFVLISLLVFLIGLLITIFLFKQQLINFFSRFFG